MLKFWPHKPDSSHVKRSGEKLKNWTKSYSYSMLFCCWSKSSVDFLPMPRIMTPRKHVVFLCFFGGVDKSHFRIGMKRTRDPLKHKVTRFHDKPEKIQIHMDSHNEIKRQAPSKTKVAKHPHLWINQSAHSRRFLTLALLNLVKCTHVRPGKKQLPLRKSANFTPSTGQKKTE